MSPTGRSIPRSRHDDVPTRRNSASGTDERTLPNAAAMRGRVRVTVEIYARVPIDGTTAGPPTLGLPQWRAMDRVAGAQVEAAVAEMVAVLALHVDLDWRAPAGSLDWSCWTTAAHVAHDLASYAGQVAGQATDGYLPFDLVIDAGATPLEVLAVVSACGRLLSSAIAAANDGPVAWHWGMADASGFAAIGVAEVLVHTYDIALGLGSVWLPPENLSQQVVAQLFADTPAGDASTILLWSTGRVELPGHPRVGSWVWRIAQS